MAHIVDSQFYGDGFSTPEIREVFSDTSRYQRWLDIEAALALAQAELGVVPEEAAREIAEKAKLQYVDLERVREGIKTTNHSLVPLLREVQKACRDGLGEYIHFGATTQDIEDTGAVLEMRDAFHIVHRDLKTVAVRLVDLAQRHRTTLMAGRTHGQQALVTTFGYRVAIWLREVIRHLKRMHQARERIFVVSLFGGVGTMSVLPRGVETMKGLAHRLGLQPSEVSWHTARDSVAEFVTLTAMIAATLGKVCNEIYVMAKTEFGELAEPHTPGKLGSSTMPHKRNPEICEQVAMLGRLTKYLAAMALESMVVEHDRDGRSWRMDWVSVPEVCCYTAAAAHLTTQLLDGLVVNVHRMAENLRLQKDFLFSEALMMELGKAMGKQTAHHVVYEAAMAAHDQATSIVDRLMENPEVRSHFDRESLEKITDPSSHLGAAITMTDEAIACSRRDLEDL